MSEEKNKTPAYRIFEKNASYLLFGEAKELGNSISNISGSIKGAYTDLKGTFSPQQMTIAAETNIEENLRNLVKLTEQQNRQLTEAQKEAEHQAKTERYRFYVSTIIAIIAIIIALIAILV